MKKAITILLAFLLATAMVFSLVACNSKCKDGEHDYVEEITAQPTCTEKGAKIQRCTKCNDVTEEVEIPALGHAYKYTPVAGQQKHTVTCTRNGCDYSEVENCTLNAAQKCTKCNADYSSQGGGTGGTGGTGGGTGGAVTVNIYIHLPSGWNGDNLKAYAWYKDSGDNSLLGEWPGTPATSDGDGWYKASFEVVDNAAIQNQNVLFQFNDVVEADEKKTGDVVAIGTDNYVPGLANTTLVYSNKSEALAAESSGGQGGGGSDVGGGGTSETVGPLGEIVLIGSITDWAINASYKLNYTEEGGEHYYINLQLHAGDQIKLKHFDDVSENWEMGSWGFWQVADFKTSASDGQTVDKTGYIHHGDTDDNIIIDVDMHLYIDLWVDSGNLVLYVDLAG